MPVPGDEQQPVGARRPRGRVERRVEVAHLARVDVGVAGQLQGWRGSQGSWRPLAARTQPGRPRAPHPARSPGRSPRRARRRARCPCGAASRPARCGRRRRTPARGPAAQVLAGRRRRTAPGRPRRRPRRRRGSVPACRTYAWARSATSVEAGDRVAGARGARVVVRGDDHGDRRVVAPAQRRSSARVPVAAACSRPPSGVFSRARTTWVSGSPKRALNSITRRPARGDREPA